MNSNIKALMFKAGISLIAVTHAIYAASYVCCYLIDRNWIISWTDYLFNTKMFVVEFLGIALILILVIDYFKSSIRK